MLLGRTGDVLLSLGKLQDHLNLRAIATGDAPFYDVLFAACFYFSYLARMASKASSTQSHKTSRVSRGSITSRMPNFSAVRNGEAMRW